MNALAAIKPANDDQLNVQQVRLVRSWLDWTLEFLLGMLGLAMIIIFTLAVGFAAAEVCRADNAEKTNLDAVPPTSGQG